MTSDRHTADDAVESAAAAARFGRGLDGRARLQRSSTRLWRTRPLLGAVGRASLGFGRAVGRSQGIRPVVGLADVNSTTLRPPSGAWLPADEPGAIEPGTPATPSLTAARRGAVAQRSAASPLQLSDTPTWTDKLLGDTVSNSAASARSSARGSSRRQAGSRAPGVPADPSFVPSGDAKLDDLRRLFAAGRLPKTPAAPGAGPNRPNRSNGLDGPDRSASSTRRDGATPAAALPLERTVPAPSRGGTAAGPETAPGRFAGRLLPETVDGVGDPGARSAGGRQAPTRPATPGQTASSSGRGASGRGRSASPDRRRAPSEIVDRSIDRASSARSTPARSGRGADRSVSDAPSRLDILRDFLEKRGELPRSDIDSDPDNVGGSGTRAEASRGDRSSGESGSRQPFAAGDSGSRGTGAERMQRAPSRTTPDSRTSGDPTHDRSTPTTPPPSRRRPDNRAPVVPTPAGPGPDSTMPSGTASGGPLPNPDTARPTTQRDVERPLQRRVTQPLRGPGTHPLPPGATDTSAQAGPTSDQRERVNDDGAPVPTDFGTVALAERTSLPVDRRLQRLIGRTPLIPESDVSGDVGSQHDVAGSPAEGPARAAASATQTMDAIGPPLALGRDVDDVAQDSAVERATGAERIAVQQQVSHTQASASVPRRGVTDRPMPRLDGQVLRRVTLPRALSSNHRPEHGVVASHDRADAAVSSAPTVAPTMTPGPVRALPAESAGGGAGNGERNWSPVGSQPVAAPATLAVPTAAPVRLDSLMLESVTHESVPSVSTIRRSAVRHGIVSEPSGSQQTMRGHHPIDVQQLAADRRLPSERSDPLERSRPSWARRSVVRRGAGALSTVLRAASGTDRPPAAPTQSRLERPTLRVPRQSERGSGAVAAPRHDPSAPAPAPAPAPTTTSATSFAAPAGEAPTVTSAPAVETPAAQLAARFLGELSATIRRRPAPLPMTFQPMADAITGGRGQRVMLSTDTASRRALRTVGKVAATTDNVIHLDRSVAPGPRTNEVIAHELTHIAHPSPTPRFFDDIDDSPEERQAESVARVMARSPLAPSASTLRPTTGTRSAGQNPTIRRRSATSSGSGSGSGLATSEPGTTTAAALAAQITGAATPPAAPPPVQRRAEPSASIAGGSQHTTGAADITAATGVASAAALVSMLSGSTDADEWFVEQLEQHFDRIVRALEDRVVIDLERRGGRHWGAI